MRRSLAALIAGLLAISTPARAGDECVTNNDCPTSMVCAQGQCVSSIEERSASGAGPNLVTVALYVVVLAGVLLAIRAQSSSQRPAAVAACVPPPR